jgi:transketolase
MSVISFVPQDEFRRIRGLKTDEASRVALFATACRLNALYAIKRAGSGHIGSSFSSLDVVSWLYLKEMTADDVYFSSKGHDVPGLYAVLTALDVLPFDKIRQLRRLGGLPGHPDVSVPGINANTGSLGMGVSKAKGIVLARRLQKKPVRVFVLLGDGELQEGQLWESLTSAVTYKMGEITAIVDCNKIQSDLWTSKVSDMGDIVAKARAFGWHAERVDGHDLKAFGAALERLRAIKDKPKFLVADTVKGRGVSFMEGMKDGERLYHYHSGAPGDVEYDKAVAELRARADALLAQAGQPALALETEELPAKPPVGKPQNLLAAYGKALLEQAERNPRIVALDADLAKDCALLPFEKKFPDRLIECGIAEQDMVSMAGGLARQGMLPFVHSFSCFLSARPNEQIYNNALEKAKVVYAGSLAGFLPAGPGTSHQAVRDISTLSAIPGFNLIEPCCQEELSLAVDWAVNKTQESTYLRLVSVSCDVPFDYPQQTALVPGRGAVLRDGGDAVVFVSGILLATQAWQAGALLERDGLRVKVVTMPWLNRVDGAWLRETVGDASHVVTLDNHYLTGGLGERLLSSLLEEGLSPRVKRFGLSGKPACGTYDEVLAFHRMDAGSLAEDIRAFLASETARAVRPAVAAVSESDIG